MNVETFNYSLESLAPFFYLNKRDRKNIYIFSTEKEALDFYKEKLGRAHKMRFGAYSLYSSKTDNKKEVTLLDK